MSSNINYTSSQHTIRDKGKERDLQPNFGVDTSKTNKRKGNSKVKASHGNQDRVFNAEASSSKVVVVSSNRSIQAKNKGKGKAAEQNSCVNATHVKKEKKSWQWHSMASNSEASSKVVTVFSENKDSPNFLIIYDLPVELFMHVFSFLPLKNLPDLRKVSHQFKKLAEKAIISKAEQNGIWHLDIRASGRTFIDCQRNQFELASKYLASLFQKSALIPQGFLVKFEKDKEQQTNQIDRETTFLKIRNGSVQEVLSKLYALLASGFDEQSRIFIAFLSERVLSEQFGDCCDSHLKEISENPIALKNYLTMIEKSFSFAAKYNYTEIMQFLFSKLNNPDPIVITEAFLATIYNYSFEAFTFLLLKVNLDGKLLNKALRSLLEKPSSCHAWVKLLIDHGPKECIDDSPGKSNIFYAFIWQLSRRWKPCVKDTLELLLTQKPSLANAQVNGITPLLYACYSDKEMLPTIQFLLKSQANPNSAEFRSGLTPLHCVVIGKDQVFEKFKLLMDNGADLHVKDTENLTPLEHIIRLELMDIIHFLIKKGENFTPVIHDIVLWGQDKILELILEKGKVDINELNDYGFSPLCVAKFLANQKEKLPKSICVDYERISYILENNGAMTTVSSKRIQESFDSLKIGEFSTTHSSFKAFCTRAELKTQSFKEIYKLTNVE